MKANTNIIIPQNMDSLPGVHEIRVAKILVNTFKTIVTFIPPVNDYKRQTPDIIMNGKYWEIKSPTASGKKTIRRIIMKAKKQSKHIIVDGARTKLLDEVICKQLRQELDINKDIKELLFIDKCEKILVIK
jgi:hypothetical protein